MAHKKAGGSVKNGRDSVGQRLGVKAGDGQLVPAGSIIVRQRGQTFLSGTGTGLGRDYTVFATMTGRVKFEHATKTKKRIRVVAADEVAAAAAAKAAAEKPATKSTKSTKSTPAAKAATPKPAARTSSPRRAAKPPTDDATAAPPAEA
jgi:large subunit ribosomal protein L27